MDTRPFRIFFPHITSSEPHRRQVINIIRYLVGFSGIVCEEYVYDKDHGLMVVFNNEVNSRAAVLDIQRHFDCHKYGLVDVSVSIW